MEQSSDIDKIFDTIMTAIIFSCFVVAIMPLILTSLERTPLGAQISHHLQSQAYIGTTDPRTFKATEDLQWIDLVHDHPYTPWINAYFINDGPDPVEIAINYPNDRFLMSPGETVTLSRSGAQDRIAIIFFKCAEGETALVRIIGEY